MRRRGDAAFLIEGLYLNKGLQLQRSRKPLRIRRKQSRPCNGLVDSCLRVGRNAGSTLRLLTEMLEVRILPGEPTPLSCSELRTVSESSVLPR
jgi:hypothetical protein